MLKYIETIDSKLFLIIVVLFSTAISLFHISELSISYDEAYTYFYANTLLHYISNFSTSIFGVSDYGLRAIFILFNIINIFLVYKIAQKYLKKSQDTNLTILLYTLIPATISASILINEAIIVIFCILLFVYIHQMSSTKSIYLLPLFIFIDNSFAIFYFSLFFYSLSVRDNRLLIVSLLLFGISMYMYGFHMGGKPKNYFLDTLSIYATLFSPLLFIHIFYSLYRTLIKSKNSIIWYIAFIPLLFSLVVSFRQKIYIEDFAPYILMGLFISISIFYNSLRVRLPEFRTKITNSLYAVMVLLILNLLIVSSNKVLYHFTDRPIEHFAYKYHIAKDLAKELKSMGVTNISIPNTKLALRLKFYGIDDSNEYYLSKENGPNSKKVSIRYMDRVVATYFVTKINKKD